MDYSILIIFIVVYVGMAVGRLPGLALDRTGVALLGLIALLAMNKMGWEDLKAAVDIPTIALLFGLMVISAQFRMGGFYSHLVRKVGSLRVSPPVLLGFLIAVAGALSAVLANDIVCLAVPPVLIESCVRRRLDPKPFLLALACAANIGSAATLIGNPQNMLIGQVLKLHFMDYIRQALPPSVIGLFLTWIIILVIYRGRWNADVQAFIEAHPPFNAWQTSKGLAVLAALVGAFLFGPWPREFVALLAAGVLLCSRRMRSREMLGLVDWQLILLFISLFSINHVLNVSGNLSRVTDFLTSTGIRLENPAWLFGISVPLSNLVSNVPAVMLLLPHAVYPSAGVILALSSTLAGNLLIVGSIANIIVVDQSSRLGVQIGWGEHAKVGIPVTLVSLAVTAAWLGLML